MSIENEQPLPWTGSTIRRAGILFFNAMYYGIQYTEQDFKYIESKVKTDKIVGFVQQYTFGIYPETDEEKYQDFYKDRIQFVVMKNLLDDPDIPKNIKIYLGCAVGAKQYFAKANAEYHAEQVKKGEHLPDYDLMLHEFFIRRWMETCR